MEKSQGRPSFVTNDEFINIVNNSESQTAAVKGVRNLESRSIPEPQQGYKNYVAARATYLRRTVQANIKTFARGRKSTKNDNVTAREEAKKLFQECQNG